MRALIHSRFMRAIFSNEIDFGHSTSQAPMFEQFPKPSSSICLTIFKTRSRASGLPWGSNASCDTFAETYNIADEFLQAATQAPQPIHAAASKALSASTLGTGIALPSMVFPLVFTDTKPPDCMILSKAERSTTRSLITGNAAALHGST